MKASTIVLGGEYDAGLRARLLEVLQDRGATPLRTSWALAGSQELAVFKVRIGQEIVTIEAETYVGLSISGNPALVRQIADEVANGT